MLDVMCLQQQVWRVHVTKKLTYVLIYIYVYIFLKYIQAECDTPRGASARSIHCKEINIYVYAHTYTYVQNTQVLNVTRLEEQARDLSDATVKRAAVDAFLLADFHTGGDGGHTTMYPTQDPYAAQGLYGAGLDNRSVFKNVGLFVRSLFRFRVLLYRSVL